MLRFTPAAFAALTLVLPLCAQTVTSPSTNAYSADASSLAKAPTPSWFRAGHLGIMVHWGPASVPAMGGDYHRRMYIPSEVTSPNPVYDSHIAHYGHPSVFGYKDLIPYWEGNQFNPVALTEQFKKLGARYVIVTASGADNVDLFPSKDQPWNSVNLGPKRDVVGEFREAVREAKLRFGVATYSNRAWTYYRPAFGADYAGPKVDVPYDGATRAQEGENQWWKGYDPRDLYGPARPGNPFAPLPTRIAPSMPPPRAYQENWYKRHAQLIETYQPDVLLMESPMPFGEHGLRLAALFYNTARSAGGPRNDGVLCLNVEQPFNPSSLGGAVAHYTRASATAQRPKPWQTDLSLTEDDYMPGAPLKVDAGQVIRALCDTASKNGNLLLNVSLDAHGALPQNQAAVLSEVEEWTAVNGEAVLQILASSRVPLGTTRINEKDGGLYLGNYNPGEVRFTAQGPFVYAIFLGWPRGDRFEIPDIPSVHDAEWLGTGKATWTATAGGVSVTLPRTAPNPHAPVLRIRIRGEDPLEF